MKIEIYKRIGETTGDLANRIKKEYNADKVAICGKLDPMARGITTALIGESTKLMDRHLTTIKTYEFKLVLNIKTDTDDIMGVISHHNNKTINDEYILNCKSKINELCESKIQHFHPFSAIKVRMENGYNHGERHSLHYWALKGNLKMSDLPTKSVNVFKKEFGNAYSVSYESYHKQIINRLSKVKDAQKEVFRVPLITDSWNRNLVNKTHSSDTLTILPIKLTVSSGFYIRMLSYYLKSYFDIDSHIFDIHRTEINQSF